MFPFRIGPLEFILFLPTLVIYFIPTIIALARHAKNITGIVLLNIFAGWTFVGWVIALIWSIVDQKQAKV
jgi:hypothetical protein